MEATGLCFEVAGEWFMDQCLAGRGDDMRLCHGIPTLQVPPYIQFWHGWVEIWTEPLIVVRNDKNPEARIPRDLFYAIGQIDPARVRRYTFADLKHWATKTNSWGPWEYRPEDAGIP